jgi:hypothetical protein
LVVDHARTVSGGASSAIEPIAASVLQPTRPRRANRVRGIGALAVRRSFIFICPDRHSNGARGGSRKRNERAIGTSRAVSRRENAPDS